MKMNLKLIFTLVCASLLCGQTPDTATLRGTVKDATGSAVSRAQVKLTDSATGVSRETESREASYVWSHAIDNVDPDIPSQNPNDPNFTGKVENASAIFDQRQRLVLSGVYVGPWKVTMGGVATLGSGLPYNYVTGTTNSGDSGATTDRPVINGVVVGRNAGSGRPTYDFSPFLERPFALYGERVQLRARVEAFNVFNHANFVGYSGTYGNGSTPGPGFGQPLAGVTNQLPARSLQFQLRVSF